MGVPEASSHGGDLLIVSLWIMFQEVPPLWPVTSHDSPTAQSSRPPNIQDVICILLFNLFLGKQTSRKKNPGDSVVLT